MAMIKCKECGKEFSDKASQCVHCGCPIDNNNKENTNTQKKNKGLDIARYILGILCLFFLISTNALGGVFTIIAIVFILPITSNFIYKKINIPKALKIIIPIVLLIIAVSVSPSSVDENKTNSEGTNNNQTQTNTNENNNNTPSNNDNQTQTNSNEKVVNKVIAQDSNIKITLKKIELTDITYNFKLEIENLSNGTISSVYNTSNIVNGYSAKMTLAVHDIANGTKALQNEYLYKSNASDIDIKSINDIEKIKLSFEYDTSNKKGIKVEGIEITLN